MRRTWALAALVVAAASLTACTQVQAIAPVGGTHLEEVRYAGIDVLQSAKIEILTAPVCTRASDGGVSCTGETLTKETITVSSPASAKTTLIVKVGDTTLYDGDLQPVLDKAAGK